MHGDEVDTSLLLYIAPELVNMELAQDYMMSRDELRRYRRGWLRVPEASPGSIGRPNARDGRKGPRAVRADLQPDPRPRLRGPATRFVNPRPPHGVDTPTMRLRSAVVLRSLHCPERLPGARPGSVDRRGHLHRSPRAARRRPPRASSIIRTRRRPDHGHESPGRRHAADTSSLTTDSLGTPIKYELHVHGQGRAHASTSPPRPAPAVSTSCRRPRPATSRCANTR